MVFLVLFIILFFSKCVISDIKNTGSNIINFENVDIAKLDNVYWGGTISDEKPP